MIDLCSNMCLMFVIAYLDLGEVLQLRGPRVSEEVAARCPSFAQGQCVGVGGHLGLHHVEDFHWKESS